MKALLLSCSVDDTNGSRIKSLERLRIALSWADIKATCQAVTTPAELYQVLEFEGTDIAYCPDHWFPDENGEQISIQTILEEKRTPYIGSSSEILDLVLSKSSLKKKWLAFGVPTPPFTLVLSSDTKREELESLQQSIEYPLILKPDAEGNSRGLDSHSIVFDFSSMESKLEELLEQYGSILVEKYLGLCPDIREFTVAMIGNGQNKLIMPAEITLKHQKSLRIITTEDKEQHSTLANPVRDMNVHGRLVSLAERAFEVAGVRDYARCDMLLAGDNLFAIEINGQPMIPDKWFATCASDAGLDADQYLNAIFLAGIARNISKGIPGLTIPPGMKDHLPQTVYDLLVNQQA